MNKKEKEILRIELINDIIATTTVMEELYRYHPDNPKKKDVEKEYNILVQIKKDIEEEIAKLDE